MSQATPQLSPSPSSSIVRPAVELTPLIEELKAIASRHAIDSQLALSATECLLRLRHTFIDDDHPREAKEGFRHLQGFQCLIDLLRKIAELYAPKQATQEQNKSLLTLFTDTLAVLAEALKDHYGNKRHFATRISGGGRAALEEIFAVIAEKADGVQGGTEQLYGGILAAALCQETVSSIFTSLESKLRSASDLLPDQIRTEVDRCIGQSETVEVPELLEPFIRVWLHQTSLSLADHNLQRLAVPACLCQLASQSQRNVTTLHSAGALSLILPLLFSDERSQSERLLYQELGQLLCTQGVRKLDDAVFLYKRAHDSPEVLRFLVDVLKRSKGPPFVQFDLSLHGFCSIEFPTMGRSFPPATSSGYTLSVWARFDQFDANTHTTIFGAFDPTQTCFLLAYLEKDTRNFILQTSIKGARPSVRFKSIAFESNRWYHICVVHKKPRPPSYSRASLFIDGEFMEQLKIEYPCMPVASSSSRSPRVQAFLGTPQDLAMRLGRGVSASRWSLSSAILFEEAYSDDLIAVFYNLGPRYYGNFQDCLGSFQTYKASASLNLRNEHLHPGKEEQSDIVTAIRKKASILIHEASIIINVSPLSVLDDDDSNTVDETRLLKSLSKQAAKNLHHMTKAGGNAVAVNGATPALNDALTQPHGIGVLTGDPVVVVPHSLDDASWCIGGCAAIHLSLLHAAGTAEATLLAVEALYEAVEDNWRNSEAMEKENGYGILAALLREKLGISSDGAPAKSSSVCYSQEERSALALKLLRLTLKFVGYDFEQANRSMITNPLAYRVLLVDLEIWRFGDVRLLELYYAQFRVFASESQFRRFNSKRLARMRVNKKLLEALKGEDFTHEALGLYIPAFQSLMESCLSADLLRSLALFITYAIHKPREPIRLQKKRSIRFNTGARQQQVDNENVKYVSSPAIAAEMLRMYCSMLCNANDLGPIKKFARAVTNKWLLYLLCEDDPEIVISALKILARLLVTHGGSYCKKFTDKTGGYILMRHYLRRWWHIPALWSLCFAMLLGQDIGKLNIDRSFDKHGLVETFLSDHSLEIAFPEMFPVITELIQIALERTVSAESSSKRAENRLNDAYRPSILAQKSANTTAEKILLLNTVFEFLSELQVRSPGFRDFATQADYVRYLLLALFPVVSGSAPESADVEIHPRANSLGFSDHNLVMRPRSRGVSDLQTTTVEQTGTRDGLGRSLGRTSSFILVSSDKGKHLPSSTRIAHACSPSKIKLKGAMEHHLVIGVLNLIIPVFLAQIMERKDFSGLGIYSKSPPGSTEHRAHFNSWVMTHLLSTLKERFLAKPDLLAETRVLTNLGRFVTHLGEAVFEGWFVDGVTSTVEFAGMVLEYLQRPDISRLKTIRLCSQVVTTIRSTVFRLVILGLSEVEGTDALKFLDHLSYWQVVLLSGDARSDHLQLLCYLLYTKLEDEDKGVRLAAAGLFRIILVQKPSDMATILSHASIYLQKRLAAGFETVVGMDDSEFLQWFNDQKEDLQSLFFGVISKQWEDFVQEENANIDGTWRTRVSKRQEKLKQWKQAEVLSNDVTRKHEATFPHWASNISASEFLKSQRALQDQQDDNSFMWSAFSKLTMDLRRYGGLLAEDRERRWRLDQTEGRSRMRLRMIPDDSSDRQDYQPKRKASAPPAIKLVTQVHPSPGAESLDLTPMAANNEATDVNVHSIGPDGRSLLEESFEMIDDPKADLEDYEDKNRKVMRSLHRGDQVEGVCNMSRVIGLEALEGLVIQGKEHIYILDNFFQRSDGEIVNVWQAPTNERDPYVQMIAGRQSMERKAQEHETRSWKWSDLISVSKRRFLFRDVAVEIFFSDGTSYLLTLISSRARDSLFSQLAMKAPQVTGSVGHARPEDARRFETLRSQEDAPQTLGSKFASVFGHSPVYPATRKWAKGEMSNFHYLMLINTLAGRTFNDLTQYPVFPWVLADYTSEELDLTNPLTFRDLSKPMGCQTSEREAGFRERYKAFAEMADDKLPPWHYGTHYSSAMIVSSYLIRLQPFVKSYLLLQGGTFDHADRLFYSIGKAWESASRGHMSDVRELIPEFFYLPEFLDNSNKYDFGVLQDMTTTIDTVELPPWAKGDPKIFIAKHREALESPYVTQNLHHWIDLVFGCKQKGEAAVEAVNVFHHLSYQGAEDIDAIEDPEEQRRTVSTIHNFGQTPHQIFSRPHPQREDPGQKSPSLDRLAESLTQLPLALLDIGEQVSSLSMRQDRLLCAAALRLNIPPSYDKYMEWGFFDGSVRFYSADHRKLLGHFEHIHAGQLSCALFADSRTLVTAGTDCIVSIWTFTSSGRTVDLQPSGSLFGHRSPVTVLAVSWSFSTLLSVSTDGQIMLWDLNRQCFVRELPANGRVDCAKINDVTGEIMICRGDRLSLYSLNGSLLLEQTVGDSADDKVMTCVFYEGVNNMWQERELLFTGHKHGVVNIWSKIILHGRFELELIRQLHHVDNLRDNGANISAGITCILALPHVVYTGDDVGRVYEWSCVQRR
ncbi:Beige/BEACH domain protein [Aspergillus saccharolyticus JOP 1030-1]|uniref:Beach-domain-containing protein n=1 Tax=Aspergillus saccharolyticus JOP 1030-1 TaxID=1450539 RepID=A0A318ZQ65_9EURO|nr:beach-domain-containing protein [Aspergillus saccharolyticus JOP 1030-1]PYH48765.1 beach-domain-containing protein [Aspergillus saccharolyticus JOP 1030-1]